MSTTTVSRHCIYPIWKNDGNCDDENNTEECDYDGGDCCTDTKKDHCTLCECKDPEFQNHINQTITDCHNPSWVGDGHCDDENNNPECDFDGGDCCLDEDHKHYKICDCKDPNHTHTEICSKPMWIGDGNCDDENNFKECDYDDGDCCSDTKHLHCTECLCKTNGSSSEEDTPKTCIFHDWIGDGVCDDENNVPECDYDGGDCCVDSEQKHCKVCECIVT